jgi:hypothetical protein
VDAADDFIAKLEEALAATAGSTDHEAIDFRVHAGPVVDAYPGRATVSEPELAIHNAWLVDFLERKGAEVAEILGTVGGTLQDIAHKARVDRHLGRSD